LLAEAEAERSARSDGTIDVVLPRWLSVSDLVNLARDPAGLAQHIRRPMPRRPVPQARRGTAFHRWLEERYGQQRLIDDDDLFGDPDLGFADAGDAAHSDLAELRATFERGEWANRWPAAVEVPFETLIGGQLVRGRIDAVFHDQNAGTYDVVDWKTGQPPRTQTERRAVTVQLAAYRLAWARLAGTSASNVTAAFYYVAHDTTVRPADVLDEAGLRSLVDSVPAVPTDTRTA
ncbi:MAG TPA: PD-(D/E)XK nuclease family protein, partial [Streptosporangiaceae bacterium]|nr:PD-(D/E)XK nuclease family protein [Streptosporangiaceae bacterium]